MIIQSDAELRKPLTGKIHASEGKKMHKAVNRPAVPNANHDGPNNLPATPAEQMPAPNNLTPNIADAIGLNHGRIGYVNHAFTASFGATSSPETAAAISTPSTWERWQPIAGGAQEITITFTENKTVNYIGLAGYDLAGSVINIAISQSATGDNFNTLAYPQEYDDQGEPLPLVVYEITNFVSPSKMVLLGDFSFTARRVKLIVTRTEPVSLGVVYLGEALALQRATRGGVTPAPLNQMTSYNTEFSAAGQILGRVINSEGVETKVSLRNLTDDWYRSDFQPFVKAAKTTPFFYLWNPRDYPNDCIYGVSSKDIAPTLQGGKKFMDVSFNIEGV